MADINKSDLFVRLYLLLELSGFLLHLVGFCTPYWRSLHFKYTEDVIQDIDIVIQGFDEGIWRRCVNGICSEINVVGRGDLKYLMYYVINGRWGGGGVFLGVYHFELIDFSLYILHDDFILYITIFLC